MDIHKDILEDPKDNVIIVDFDNNEIYSGHNEITQTHRNKYADFLIGTAVTTPSHIAIGSKVKLDTESNVAFTKLKSELARVAITSAALQSQDTARFAAILTAGVGTGTIREVGLFNAAESTVEINDCDANTNWSVGAGSLVVDTTEFQEGTASLKNQYTGNGGETDSFTYLPDPQIDTEFTTNANGIFQFWYYNDNVAACNAADMQIDLVTLNSNNRYVWTVRPGSELTNGWNWFHLPLADATISGTPNVETQNVDEFRILITVDNSINVTQRVDRLRLFEPNGDLWARFEPPVSITKQFGTVVGIYWFFSMREGGAELAFTAFDSESITVSTSAIGFTSSKISPSGGGGQARQAIVFINSGGPIRWNIDGTNPTSTTGQGPYESGEFFTLEGITNISNLRMIRDTTATGDATVHAIYLR